jgi:type I restriction enzyme S subunit
MNEGYTPVVGSNGIIGYHNKFNVKRPVITVGRSGTVGKPHIYFEDCWVHNTALYIDDFKGNNPEYLFYLLKGLNIDKVASSTGVPTLNRNFVHPIKINFENDLGKQKDIAKILMNIDLKIANNSKINEELELMAKTLYEYWFLQFEFPNEEGKPYKSSGGKMVWNEELKREIPQGWEVKHAHEIAEIKTGKEDANHATKNGQYPFFTCSNEILNCDDYRFEGNVILIAGNGDFNVKHYNGRFNAYQRTYVVKPHEDKHVGLFHLCSLLTVDQFKRGSNGSIVKFIKLGDVQNIKMLDSKKDEIYDVFNVYLKKISSLNRENQELISLRDFLLPLLMNGQVTFK